MRHTFIASTAVLAALALAAPLYAQGHAVPRGGSSGSGSSGSSGGSSSGSGESTVNSSGGGRQSAPRVGSSRGGGGHDGGTSVRERSVPSSTGVGSPSSSTSRARGRIGVATGTSSVPGAIGAGASRVRDTSGVTGRAVPRSSRPATVRPAHHWYYPGWSRTNYHYSPWLYGTYGYGAYFYDPWWMMSYGYGYDPYDYGGYGGGYDLGYSGGYGGGYGGSGGGRSITVSDYGQVRLKVKPTDAEVFVDGQRKGEVREFDGVWERLKVPYGTHVIEVRREGYQPRAWDVTLNSKDLVTIEGDLREK